MAHCVGGSLPILTWPPAIDTFTESVTVEFELRNELTIPINLHDLALTCVFEPAPGTEVCSTIPCIDVDSVARYTRLHGQGGCVG